MPLAGEQRGKKSAAAREIAPNLSRCRRPPRRRLRSRSPSVRPTYGTELERGRIRRGHYRSNPGDCHGAFVVAGPCGMALTILAGDASDPITQGWDHVSVSGRRTPNWQEMAFVKDLFWGEEELVVQFHPRKAEYVNVHPHCLHLWSRADIPSPPTILVGPMKEAVNG